MKYEGSCHCGNISFELEGDIDNLMECNCSICSRRGYLLWFVPKDRVHFKGPEPRMGTYTFNKHMIKHNFCPTCGCAPFSEGTGPGGKETVAINLRCADGIDPASLKIIQFDGARVPLHRSRRVELIQEGSVDHRTVDQHRIRRQTAG